MVEDFWGCQADPLLEVGGDISDDGRIRTFEPGSRPLKLVWSGQHIGRKALPLLLRAIKSLNGSPSVHLTVLGDGPETSTWKSLADELGVSPFVRWTGRVAARCCGG